MSNYVQELENVDRQEEAVYYSIRVWRASIGRGDWVDIGGMWRRTSLGYGESFSEEMSESEIQVSNVFSDMLDYLVEEKKTVILKYLENIK